MSAAAAIDEAVEQDPELEVKEQAVFALSQLPASSGVPKLLRIARTHRQPEPRKTMMLWLARSQTPEALEFFEELPAP